MNTNYYFCTECKTSIEESKDVLLVDDSSKKGFCTEACIEKFYAPAINHYRKIIKEKRSEFKVSKESFENIDELVASCLKSCDEVWMQKNELDEKIYFLYKKHNSEDPIHIGIGCIFYEGQPSFILYHCMTTNKALIESFKVGEKQEIANLKSSKFKMDPKLEESIGRKKSSELASLIEKRQDSDIPIDDFHLYDSYLTTTLEAPDEIYQYKDIEDDILYTYIKVFNKNNISFYFICICHLLDTDIDNEQDVLLPVLSFPTLDPSLYQNYQKDKKLSGQLKN